MSPTRVSQVPGSEAPLPSPGGPAQPFCRLLNQLSGRSPLFPGQGRRPGTLVTRAQLLHPPKSPLGSQAVLGLQQSPHPNHGGVPHPCPNPEAATPQSEQGCHMLLVRMGSVPPTLRDTRGNRTQETCQSPSTLAAVEWQCLLDNGTGEGAASLNVTWDLTRFGAAYVGGVGKAKWDSRPWPKGATATLPQRPSRPDHHPGRRAPKPAPPHHTAASPSDKLLKPPYLESLSPTDWELPEKAEATPWNVPLYFSRAFHTAHRYSTKFPADQNRIIVGQLLSLLLLIRGALSPSAPLFAFPPSRHGSWAQGHCLTHP